MPINRVPTLSGLAASVTFGENLVNATPQLLDASVTFTDADNNFNNRTLTVSGLLAEDTVAIRNQGTGAGQIGVSGSNITFGGVTIGSFAGGTGATLTVTLNASATAASIEALIENLTYSNSSDTPAASRTLEIDLSDAAGAAVVAPVSVTQHTGAANPFSVYVQTWGGSGISYTAPIVGDLDGDGDLDLAVGSENGGFHYFENTGSATEPEYTARLSGHPLETIDTDEFAVGSLADLDLDGDLDLLVAGTGNEGTEPRLRYFINTGDTNTPVFTEAQEAGFGDAYYEAFNDIDLDGGRVIPTFVDLDGDNDYDLVLATETGVRTFLFNSGSTSFFELTGSDNPFEGVSFAFGDPGGITFADLDGDGDPDAVLGDGDGDLRYFTNIGRTLDDPASLFVEQTGAANPFNVDLGFSSMPALADIDGDGDADLVVGEYEAVLNYFENTTPTSFEVTVNVTAQSEPPVVGANTGLTLAEGATAAITAEELDFDDTEQADSAITYTVTAVNGGTLFRDGVALGISSTFTQADINDGLMTFSHGGGEGSTATFDFDVSDGAGGTVTGQEFVFTVTPVNDVPALNFNTGLTVAEGATGTITAAMLDFNDPDNADNAITYTVIWQPTDGTLFRLGVALGVGSTFTQSDINLNRITYTHAGGENTSASFGFDVWDGVGVMVTGQTFAITVTPVNDAPTANLNTGLTVAEGATATITAAMLDFNDIDNADSSIVYTVTEVDGGTLYRDGLALSINSTFTQSDINNNLIAFDHFGGESSNASFDFQVSNGSAVGVVTGQTFAISVTPTNDAPTFGVGDGIVTTPIGTGHEAGHEIVVLPDGGILVAGYTGNAFGAFNDFALVRYTATGALDLSFGGGDGIVTTSLEPGSDFGRSVVVQPDGAILVAGYSHNGSNDDFALVRYNADGTLDTTFGGGDGIVTTPIGASTDEGHSVTVQPDGGILVAGYSFSGSNNDFALVRYNADGTLDTTFGGGDGIVTTPVGAENDYGSSVTVQLDGRILVAGYSRNDDGFNYDLALVRYNADGTLDTTFGGGDGIVVTSIEASNGQGHSVTVQPDGAILVAGHSSNDFALVRYTAAGDLDASFGGGDGIVTTPIVGIVDRGFSVALQPDGAILVAGYSHNGSNYDFALVRYTAAGVLDTTFGGGDGTVTTGIGTQDEAYSVAVQPDGRILVSGRSLIGSTYDFTVVRYNADGTLDTTFDPVSTLNATPTFIEGGSAVVLDSNAAISDVELDAANSYSGATLTLARQGGADASDVFGATGTLSLSSGNVVLGGVTVGTFTQTGGTLTITFNADATSARTDEVLQQITYSNTSDNPPATVQIAWTFNDGNTGAQGGGGAMSTTGSITVSITPTNDAPVVNVNAGLTVAEGAAATITAAMLDFNDIDSADSAITYTITTAASGGTLFRNGVELDVGSTFTQADIAGNLITYEHDGGESPAATFGFDVSDGAGGSVPGQTFAISVTPVNDAPTFVSGGIVVTPVGPSGDNGRSILVQPDGRIVVAGYGVIGSSNEVMLLRYNADGSLDTTFGGGDGIVTTTLTAFDDLANDAVLQPDGAILVTGRIYNGANTDLLLIRYNADGSLDTTFGGGDGIVVSVFGSFEEGQAITLQPDGRILVGGTIDGDVAVVRYNTDGTLDTTFGGGDGFVTTSVGSDAGWDVAVQPDGAILVVGSAQSGFDTDILLVRYTAAGVLDTTFGGGDGIVTTSLGSNLDVGTSVQVLADGRILVAGIGGGDFAAVRYNADGSLDTTFGGGDGIVTTAFGSGEQALEVLVLADGRFVLAGFASDGVNSDVTLLRYNADGTLDTTFGGGDGIATASLTGASIGAVGAALLPDGRIVVTGFTFDGQSDIPVVRFNADGTLDLTFNTNELDDTPAFTEGGSAVVLDRNVVITDVELEAANSYSGATLTLARQGGADAQDVFGATGTLSLTGGNVVLGGVTVGTFTQTGGTLTITFNANATADRTDQVLNRITYSNTSDNPPATVQVAWTFSDGNSGAQGAGGAQSATGSITVTINAVNDMPTVNLNTGLTVAEGATATITAAMLDFNDLEQADSAITYTITTAVGGGTLYRDGAALGLGSTFTQDDINNGRITYDHFGGESSSGTFGFQVSDGDGGTVTEQSFAITVTPTNDAPTFALGDGIVTTDAGSTIEDARGVVVQPDGRIVVAGSTLLSGGAGNDFLVARYNPDGSLDTTFGGSGIVTTPVGSGYDNGLGVALQSDGRIVVVGSTSTVSGNDVALVRYNTDGSLDTTFGGDGMVTTPIGASHDTGYSVVVQPDGRIVVTGSAFNGSDHDIALVRYNADGSLDTTFGGGAGFVTTPISASDFGFDIAVQPDGRIVVGGLSGFSSNTDFTLVRYNADGTLDTSFGGDGIVTTALGASGDDSRSIALLPDGSILVAGGSIDVWRDVALVRYTAAGDLDTSFGGGDGIVTTPIAGANGEAYSMAVQSDGRIVLAGTSGSDFLLIRYNADGSIDTSFGGGDGIVTIAPTFSNFGFSVAIQPDGQIVVSGYTGSIDRDIAVLRFNADGTLDTTFDAVNTLNATPSFTEGGSAVVLDASAAIYDVELEAANSYAGATLTLARQGGANASDVFGATGTLSFASGNVVLNGVTVGTFTLSGGTLTITFNANATAERTDQVLQQITYTNTSDNPPATAQIAWTFNDGNTGAQGGGGAQSGTGSITVTINAVNDAPTLGANTGATVAEGATTTITAAMLDFNDLDHADGAITYTVTTAASEGTLFRNGVALDLGSTFTQADINNSLITYQHAGDEPAAASFGFSVSDGTDTITGQTFAISVTAVNDAPTFAMGDGIVTTPVGASTDIGYSVTVQPDGRILVAGISLNGSEYDFALVRYNADGTLDTMFGGGDGIVTTGIGPSSDYAYSVALQPDGGILVAGSSYNGSEYDFALARYNADGTLDTTFGGGDGFVTTPVGTGYDFGSSVAVQPDGAILVAGNIDIDIFTEAFALVRYTAAGVVDTSFGGGDGIVITQIGTSTEQANGVVVQPDGAILVAGYSYDGSTYDFTLLRYTAAGVLDTTFGGDGIVTTGIGAAGDFAYSVALQPDGGILVAGQSHNGSNYDFALVRYNADGSLDNTFGGDGIVTTPIGSAGEQGRSVTVQPDGRIIVAGYSRIGATDDFALVRYNADGTLDTTFGGGDGIVTTAVGSATDLGYSVALQPDGRIVVAGFSRIGSTDDFALLRYNADGSLDTTFDAVSTLNSAPSFTEGGTAVVLDADAVITDAELDAANSYAGATLTLARQGAANASDVFGGSGTLSLTGGNVIVGGVTVGTFTQTGGTLTITFNASATAARTDQVLQQITYTNTSDNPPATAQIAWTFSDGNSASAQGSGGAQSATGSITVTINATNDAPAVNVNAGLTVNEGATATITAGMLDFNDPDHADSAIVYTITARPDAGTLFRDGVVLRVGSTFTQADINNGLITYDHFDGEPLSASFGFDVSDGTDTITGQTFAISVTSVNDAPTFAVGDGIVTAGIGTSENFNGVVVQPDGRIIAAGSTGGISGSGIL